MRQSIPGMKDAEFRRLYVYCLIPDCSNFQKDRGVCRQHLEAVQKQVDNNEVTWKAYEEAGYSRPPGPVEELRDRRLHRGPVDECMTEECEHPAIARGLCSNCYQSSYRLIRQRKTTWEKLEEVGVAQKGTRVRRGIGESLVCKKIEAAGGLLEETDRHLGRKPPVAPEQPEPAAPAELLIASPEPAFILSSVEQEREFKISDNQPYAPSQLITSPGVVEDLNRLAEEPQPAPPLGQPPKEKFPGWNGPLSEDQEAVKEEVREALAKHTFQPPKEEAPSAEELSFVNAPKPESEALDETMIMSSQSDPKTFDYAEGTFVSNEHPEGATEIGAKPESEAPSLDWMTNPESKEETDEK